MASDREARGDVQMKSSILLFTVLALVSSCKDQAHTHGEGEAAHGGHGHGHGHGGELAAESVTLWTAKAELFMEWDPLIVGHESRFLAHITNMTNPEAFKAVAEGKVVVTVTVGGAPVRASVEKPARLGIFIPAMKPTKAGPCTMTLALESSALSETFNIEPCVVHADEAGARAAADDSEAPGQISFLKEQQWPIDFATVAANKQSVVPSKTINAKILAVPGREARLTAGTMGRVSLRPDAPTLGGPVKKGQLLARIQPTVSAPGTILSLIHI